MTFRDWIVAHTDKNTARILKFFLVVFVVLFFVAVYKQGFLNGSLKGCPKEIMDCCLNRDNNFFFPLNNSESEQNNLGFINSTVFVDDSNYTTDGEYNYGVVTIRAYKIPTRQDYLFVANHEYAHYLWDYNFTKKDLNKWILAINVCGFESEYAKSFRSRSVRLKEEWADSYASFYVNYSERAGVFCEEKIKFIKEW